MTPMPGASETMKRTRLLTLLSALGIGAVMILAAALVTQIGSAALGNLEVWQQAFDSIQPYLR